MQLGSDGESHAGDPPPHQPPPVMSLSVAEDGMAVLESAGGGTAEHAVGATGGIARFSGAGGGGDHGSASSKNNGYFSGKQGVFAVPTKPPPNSAQNHVGSGAGDAMTVRSAFQVPRPVSAPLSKQRSQIRPETVDMDTLGKLSPRAFPHATPNTGSIFRSPSAPPAPFFPHRDSDEDDDDEDEEEEDDPFIRQILEQFSIDRKAALDDNSRRFSEGFALSQKVNLGSLSVQIIHVEIR